MERNDTIGIVGIITEKPCLILDAQEWKKKVFETKLKRMRPSGTYDEFILQFPAEAAGEKENLKSIIEGVEVLVGGEVRSQNILNPSSTENRVKIFIYAEAIVVNDPPACQQNEVKICGNICRMPRPRHIRRGEKKIAITDIIVAVKSQVKTCYIPCVCWGEDAEAVAHLKVGTYVELIGRLQSRQFKRIIKGNPVPYLMTAYEISVTEVYLNSGKEGNIK